MSRILVSHDPGHDSTEQRYDIERRSPCSIKAAADSKAENSCHRSHGYQNPELVAGEKQRYAGKTNDRDEPPFDPSQCGRCVRCQEDKGEFRAKRKNHPKQFPHIILGKGTYLRRKTFITPRAWSLTSAKGSECPRLSGVVTT